MSRILVVDDEPTVLSFMTALLTRDGYEVVTASGGDEAVRLLNDGPCDLLITDYMMNPMNGMELLLYCQDAFPNMPTVMISGYCTVENAIQVLKAGAFDYLPKPVKVNELREVVGRAVSYQSSLERRHEHKVNLGLGLIVAESAAMRKVCTTIERLLPTRTHCLIMGPEGTGKELVARTIHDCGVAKDGPFIRVDCTKRPETELENELFGPRTPDTQPSGVFQTALGGTLYLSEIGSLPFPLQERLDRILASDHSTDAHRGGSRIAVQICAGSHDPLEAMGVNGNFSGGLYQRLRPFSMVIPPLRERPEDVLGLACYCLNRGHASETTLPCMDSDAELVIEHYPWPGNSAELIAAVTEAREKAGVRQITVDDLPQKIVAHVNVESLRERHKMDLAESKGKMLKSFLREKERGYLQSVVDSTGGKEEAAKKLHLDASGLDRHISGNGK